ncbi:MAG TPA: GAF domain-containing sensor histidine kinase [Gaiellaceae bacterium]|nr:GAF domain-containing sensor histidine kinase [Gaiellaceae bacterium]
MPEVDASETGLRQRALVEAGIAITSQLSLDAVLHKLIETAVALTGARYGALGVIDRTGRELERFLTVGVDDETHRAIGDPPRGRGILGVLIHEARPLRLHDLTQDPRSVGFPPYHPEMRTFLGVPVRLRGVVFGNLYLTDKAGGEDFTEEDEELVTLLAAQAAVAIENARLYESATRWLRQLESLDEVGQQLVGEFELPRLLALVASRLRELVEARLVIILLPAETDLLRVAAADGEGAESLLDLRLPAPNSKSGRVLTRRRSERVDALLDDPEVDQDVARKIGAITALYVPLIARGRPIGVMVAHDKTGADVSFTDEDVRLAESFAQRAAVAVDISERVVRDSLRRVVTAQELERRRLARELHDETGQALTSVLLGLRSLEEAKTLEEAKAGAASLRELVVDTLQGVRRLAVELRPKALDDFGLVPAIERLAETFSEQTGIAVDFEQTLTGERLTGEIETALYRIVQEGLTNVVKHAGASRVSVVLARKPDAVTAIIEDDGRGFESKGTDGRGLGLVGMRERLRLLDGKLSIESTQGAGTTIVAEVPLPPA